MTKPDSFSPYDPDVLPTGVVRYLAANAAARGRQAVIDVFAPDARVTDESIRYEGRDAIEGWLGTVATEYTYTTTLLGQREEEPDTWMVRARLDGDFPGGVAELGFRFTVQGNQIAELVIAPL